MVVGSCVVDLVVVGCFVVRVVEYCVVGVVVIN